MNAEQLAAIKAKAKRHRMPDHVRGNVEDPDFHELCDLVDKDVPALIAEVERLKVAGAGGDLAAIRERAAQATPGPWGWFGNTDVHTAYLATKRFGRMYVMGFRRWGLQGAQPVFTTGRAWKPNPDSGADFAATGYVKDGSQLARYEVAPDATSRRDPRVYRADLTGFKNPDAEFIAHARQDVDDLLALVDRLQAELAEAHWGGATVP